MHILKKKIVIVFVLLLFTTVFISILALTAKEGFDDSKQQGSEYDTLDNMVSLESSSNFHTSLAVNSQSVQSITPTNMSYVPVEVIKYRVYLVGFTSKPNILDMCNNIDITDSDGVIWTTRPGNVWIATIYSLREGLWLRVSGTGVLGPWGGREIYMCFSYPFAYYEQGVPFAIYLNPVISGNTRNLNYWFASSFSNNFNVTLSSASTGKISNEAYTNFVGRFTNKAKVINFTATDEVSFSVRSNVTASSAQWRFGDGNNTHRGFFSWREYPLANNIKGAVIDVAEIPQIYIQPESVSIEMSTGGTHPLSVAAVVYDGGVLSYQWYSNTVECTESGTAITNETNAIFNAPINSVGTVYYYVKVINTNHYIGADKASSVYSDIAAVTVDRVISESAIVSLTLDRNRGDYVSVPFAVSGADNLESLEFHLMFNPDEFELISACDYPVINAQLNSVTSANVIITDIREGLVSFKVSSFPNSEQPWSGIVNVVKLKTKKTGNLSILCYYE